MVPPVALQCPTVNPSWSRAWMPHYWQVFAFVRVHGEHCTYIALLHTSDLEENKHIFNDLQKPRHSEREQEKPVAVWVLLSEYVLAWAGMLAAQGHYPCSSGISLTGFRMKRSLKVHHAFHFSTSGPRLAHGAELYLSDCRGQSRNNMFKLMRLMRLDCSHDGGESWSWQSLRTPLRELHPFFIHSKKRDRKTK